MRAASAPIIRKATTGRIGVCSDAEELSPAGDTTCALA